jgi:1-acyl-sn-glycerol-3-phosphate acyltransferase
MINQDRIVSETTIESAEKTIEEKFGEGKRSEGKLTNRLLQTFNALVCRIYHQLNVISPCNLPRTGPAILICNHTSGLDPCLIQSVCPRMIVWMMAREYYNLKALRKGYEMIDAIPVDRGGRDMPATRAALRALEHGRVLGIFPEGKIETSHDLLPFQPGIALLANKSQAPVYPAYLDGSQRDKKMTVAVATPQRAFIAFGPPLAVPAAPPVEGHRHTKRDAEQFAAAVAELKELVDSYRLAERRVGVR